MPTPKPGDETHDDWMGRCVPKVLDDGTAKDQDQALAICMNMWREAEKSTADRERKAVPGAHSLYR
jgi:hypothetical protein